MGPGLWYDSKRYWRIGQVTRSGDLPPARFGFGVARSSGSVIYRDPRGRLPVPADARRTSAEGAGSGAGSLSAALYELEKRRKNREFAGVGVPRGPQLRPQGSRPAVGGRDVRSGLRGPAGFSRG